MSYTGSDLLQTVLGVAAFSFFGFAPGYLLSAVPLFRPTGGSWSERALWSTVLSMPLSIQILLIAGRYAGTKGMLGCFAGAGAAAILLFGWELVRARARRRQAPLHAFHWTSQVTTLCVAVFALVLYCVLAPLGIQIGHKLYESSLAQDWGLRAQMVYAAVRAGVSPGNPMFATGGHAVPLPYYYFWYIPCAQICRLTGISARAALTASCVWSGLSLVCCIFLVLKYMGLSRRRLRKQYAVGLLVACVLGLDVIPSLVGVMLPRARLYPDIQFWQNDRSPSWLGTLIWAPHHVAGFVACMIAVLLLFLLRPEDRWPRRVAQALLASVLFAAAVGTSTYIFAFFALACLFLLVERIGVRDWGAVGTFLLVAVFTLILSHRFLSELLAAPAATAAGVAHAAVSKPRVLQFMVRHDAQANHLYMYFTRPLSQINKTVKATAWQRTVRVPTMLLLYLSELGFFVFVIAYRIRQDWIRKRERPLSKHERWLWLLLVAFALPGLFITSAALQSNNDVGRHAGMCSRFIFMIWATPMVEAYLSRRGLLRSKSGTEPLLLRTAEIMFVLGLVAQVWQIAINRLYLPLVDSYQMASTLPSYRFPQISRRFYDIRQAMDVAAKQTDVNAIVQSNPQGRLQALFQLYASRQMAAGDTGCAVPFGGDPAECVLVAGPIVALFGGSGVRHQGDSLDRMRLPYDASMVTPAAFRTVCRDASLTALVASYTDPAWHVPDSWVWTETPIFANGTARVFLCPPHQ